MAFKGTERRSASDIAEEIEAVGGELNAATSLETTAYFARVLKADIGLALDILADILQIPRYAEDELEREREVILQEIAATRDSPDEIAYELLQDAAFPDQAIGRPILGTTAERQAASAPPTCAPSSKANYGAKRMVLSAAGKVDHAELVRHAEAQFGGHEWRRGRPIRAGALCRGHAHVGQAVRAEPSRDGVRRAVVSAARSSTPPRCSPALFGGGMSSRLFQEVRERRGLCYAIYSSCWALADTGLFGIHAATGPEMMEKLIDVVGERAARAPPPRSRPRPSWRAPRRSSRPAC